jgi:hypothetical protein
MRLTFPERSIGRIYQALMMLHLPLTVVWPTPSVASPSVASIPPQDAYVLLRSYYFFSVDDFSQVLWKSSEGRLPYRLSGKTIVNRQGFASSERPWPACSNVFMLLIGRSIGADPKLFLENSLIKSLPDGSLRKGIVACDPSVFKKFKLGSVFQKV